MLKEAHRITVGMSRWSALASKFRPESGREGETEREWAERLIWYTKVTGSLIFAAWLVAFIFVFGANLAETVAVILVAIVCLVLIHFLHTWIMEKDSEKDNDYHALALPEEESDMRGRQG